MKKCNWIFFVLHRFNYADACGRSSVTTFFSISGIAFGVMVLIVILSIMNGFQMGYIDTILQISSAHIRLAGCDEDLSTAENLKLHKAFFKFNETQTLIQGNYSRQSGVLIRSVETDILKKDKDFADTLEIVKGTFSITENNSLVIGNEIARNLSVTVGDTVSILAVSGKSGSDIFPENKLFVITGIFKTGYYAIDSSFAFTSLQTGEINFGKQENLFAAVKLKNQTSDAQYIFEIQKNIPQLKAESWRTYNHAFFGALRVEKNMMMLLVILIFVVVTVNIYNGMRRSIYERREDISVLASLGAYPKQLKLIFIANGFTIGLIGSVIGLLLGLLISTQVNSIFEILEQIINSMIVFISTITNTEQGNEFSVFNPVYFYMENIPVRIFLKEVFFIFLFGIFSASIAATIAAQKILRIKPAEVLRYE